MNSLSPSYLLLHIFWLTASVFASGKVPVLVWTNSRSLVFPQQLAGHSASQQEFKHSVTDWICNEDNNVVVFLQEKLGVFDFIRFSDVFGANDKQDSYKHLKSILSEMTSTYLPSVASPSSVLTDVRHQKKRKVQIIDDPNHFSLTSDDYNSPHLFIVKLPELHHSEKSFNHLDKIIGLVTSQVKSLVLPFVAFYTAEGPTHRSSLSRTQYQGRRTLEATELSGSEFFFNLTDTFYLYSKNLSLNVKNGSYLLEIDQGSSFDGSNCNETGSFCEVYLNFKDLPDSTGVSKPKLILEFNLTTGSNSGFWYLSRFQLSYSIKSGGMFSEDYKTNFIGQTPKGYSYHCSVPNTIKVANDSIVDSNFPSIYFNSFQVQVYKIAHNQFGHYNDCVGFFTIGIWMFLIVTFVLLAILFFGIVMLANITTMDRFDDPKGKTITVNVAE